MSVVTAKYGIHKSSICRSPKTPSIAELNPAPEKGKEEVRRGRKGKRGRKGRRERGGREG